MGRKKKKQMKPWCWYCNREFEDEKILIQHQKAKHFKCHICNKKLYTGPGLAIHCMQVHKETIDKIPGAVPGRDNVNVEVYGMEGIPPDMEPQAPDDSGPSAAKMARTNMPMQGMMMPGMPGMPPMPMPMPGMPSMQPFVPAAVTFGGPIPLSSALRPDGRMSATAMLAAGLVPGVMPMSSSSAAAGIPMPPGSQLSGIPEPPRPPPPAAAFAAYQQQEGGGQGKEGEGGVNVKFEPKAEIYDASSSSKSNLLLGGAKTRIIVPDEHTSLEELLAQRIIPQYARGLAAHFHP